MRTNTGSVNALPILQHQLTWITKQVHEEHPGDSHGHQTAGSPGCPLPGLPECCWPGGCCLKTQREGFVLLKAFSFLFTPAAHQPTEARGRSCCFYPRPDLKTSQSFPHWQRKLIWQAFVGFVRVSLTLTHPRSCPEVETTPGSRIRCKGKNRVLLHDKSKHSVVRPETLASEGAQNRSEASQRSNSPSVFAADFNSQVSVSLL